MPAPTAKSAQQLLDEVHRLAQLDAFDTSAYLARLAAEIEESGADPAAAVDDALAGIDRFAERAMRVRLDHLLAHDSSVPRQFRTYLATQVLDYTTDLPGLRGRVMQVVSRADPNGALDTANAVADAADEVFALRAALRQGALALVPEPEPQTPSEPQPDPDFFELIELD